MNLDILEAEYMPQLSLKSLTGIETLHINLVQNMGREETESKNNAVGLIRHFSEKIKQCLFPH